MEVVLALEPGLTWEQPQTLTILRLILRSQPKTGSEGLLSAGVVKAGMLLIVTEPLLYQTI